MKIVSALCGATLLIGAAQFAGQAASALPIQPASRSASPSMLAESINHRVWRRPPTSPFYSFGYPRLYYYPWGVEPRSHLRNWRHR